MQVPFLDLRNGWADCLQTWFVAYDSIAKRFALVYLEVPLHVRTCKCRFQMSGMAGPIAF